MIELLKRNEILLETDFVRCTRIDYEGHEYAYGFSDYGTPINRFKWIPVKYLLPAFVGRSLEDYYRNWYKSEYDGTQHDYEVIRGKVPLNHIDLELWREDEDSKDYVKNKKQELIKWLKNNNLIEE